MAKQKLTKQKRELAALFLFPVVMLTLVYQFWLYDPRVDALERRARRLSGWSAIDCGQGGMTDYISKETVREQAAIDACARESAKAGKAFRVRFTRSGPGFFSAEMIVGTGRGEMFRLYGDPVKQGACSRYPCR